LKTTRIGGITVLTNAKDFTLYSFALDPRPYPSATGAVQPVTSNDASSGPLAAVRSADHTAPLPGRLTEPALWALVIRHAQCSESDLDPDQWFPVSADPGQARQEAAAAIAICTTCPVRGHCLTLSMRRWDIGQHGVWGGLVAADRARLRRRARPHRGRT
jgi:Transcription factor WhiB